MTASPTPGRGRTIAVTEFGWSLAFILGIPLMGFLIARSGWMAPFPLMAVLGVLIFVGLFWMLPKDGQPSADIPTFSANFRTVLTFAPALAGLAVGLFASAANEVVNLIFGVWLEDSFGLQIAALGAASAVIGLSELCGEGLVAAFVDRLGKPRAIGLGLAANCLAALLLFIIGRTEAGALVGLVLLLYYLRVHPGQCHPHDDRGPALRPCHLDGFQRGLPLSWAAPSETCWLHACTYGGSGQLYGCGGIQSARPACPAQSKNCVGACYVRFYIPFYVHKLCFFLGGSPHPPRAFFVGGRVVISAGEVSPV